MAENSKPEDEDHDRPGSQHLKIWEFGVGMAAKVTGGLFGVAVTGYLSNPFLGAAAGTSLAHALEKGGLAVVKSKLGPRQAARVGRTITVAAIRMEERVSAGETPRTDKFAQPDQDGRSDAEEAVEAVLFAAMNSAEEKKVDFLGLLLTNIAFDTTITPADAQLMIETAEALRYRGYVILKIASNVHDHGWPVRGGEDVTGPPGDLYILMAQIYDMIRRGLIELKNKPDDNSIYAVLGVDEVEPSKLHLSPLGLALYKHMELHRLPDTDETYVQTMADLTKLSRYGRGPTRIDGGEL